ncbi:MAG: translation initiation factor IF-2 [Amoebophilaceae bacterium]|jgi:translation initiation factor IF-2|nr:translation initiation factor IF-2 [Amoebophilaceae bacterium]
MAEGKTMRLSQAARKLNVGTNTIVAFLLAKGIEIENQPHTKITPDQFHMLAKEFAGAATDKAEASAIAIGENYVDNRILVSDDPSNLASKKKKVVLRHETIVPQLPGITVVGTAVLEQAGKPLKANETPSDQTSEATTEVASMPLVEASASPVARITVARQESLKGLTVLGSMDLPGPREKKFHQVASSDTAQEQKKRPRKRIVTPKSEERRPQGKVIPAKESISEKEIQEQIKNTLAKLGRGGVRDNRTKYRRGKRLAMAEAQEESLLRVKEEAKILRVTEFISANDLASFMGVSVNEVIAICMSLGMAVSINQRLDAESITIIADEFGYRVEFTDLQEETVEEEEEDRPEDLVSRAPIVTVMGHVDHGKTSLLDYIRKTQITKGEAGGITQHIGAYDVVTESGARVAFLDTPGHEAFTAMRARGAKITDIVIVVVAADDRVMPQTKEAINHAQIAGVPIVVAINKVDKPEANPDRIKEELSGINVLVEEWGGKYQSQDISAKTGQGIEELLEKVLLEAELLALQANPHKKARGTVLEASLDQGKGYVATLMVQSGTLKMGDVVLAGAYYGKVKAMTDHRARHVKKAIPSTSVQILGLNGPPQAGDTFRVMDSDREAREVAIYKQQIMREQSLRVKTHITLDEIGRRLAIGNFRELNILLKGDVDGSVEALADALLKLSTEEIQVNIVYKSVGAISESDVLLASATDAIVIGFQVRPSASVRKLAEKEGIEILLYSIIYDAINHVKDAMQGMLAPSIKEVITGNATVREVFRISKVGTVAGCYVTDGYIKKSNQIRLIRDGIVIYTGHINQLKRFKEDVREVKSGVECGASVKNFNDIKVNDIIEGFEKHEVARTL